MDGYSVTVLGDKVIARRLLRVGRNGADLTDAWDAIMDQFEDWTIRQFDSRGAFFGTPWEPLEDDTIAAKRRHGAADPDWPLVDYGDLALSFLGGPDHIREAGPSDASWGSKDENAGWHHGRVRSEDNPVPRRPIFELDETKRRWVMQVLQRHVMENR